MQLYVLFGLVRRSLRVGILIVFALLDYADLVKGKLINAI